jgi:SAM-dependent methyltransferase
MAGSETRPDCRLCGELKLERVLSLSPTPPANAFVTSEARGQPQQAFPLDLYLCTRCAHLQLLEVVDPKLLFENYVYVSGTSPVFVEHFRRYAETVIARYEPAQGSLVVDIGSNDGTLLGFFRERGHRVLGIDPAREIAREASSRGIETLNAFFTPELARQIRRERGPAAVITANNVYAHIDDLAGVTDGIRELLADTGVFVFEVSYLTDVYQKTLFDTIYHEHLAYHTVKPLVSFLDSHGLELIEADRVDTHGGSLRGTVQLKGGSRAVGSSVAQLIALESELGLDRPETFERFGKQIDALGARLRSLLGDLRGQGKRIAGFGAPAKATTLMHHFRIGADTLEYIVDDSPWKQGLYTPGLHVPVVPATALVDRHPDYLVLLAWNFARPIIEKQAAFRNAGGRFIIPLPELEVV